MKTGNRVPDWLLIWVQNALLGEIYPAIRVIAVSFSEERTLVMRWYLDHAPEELDYENIDVVATVILSNTSSNDEIKAFHNECVFSDMPQGSLDTLDRTVYARKE